MSKANIQIGGRIQPYTDWKLWRFASLLHFLRQDKSWSSTGSKKVKPFSFHTLESKSEMIFPAKKDYQPLDRNYQLLVKSGRLQPVEQQYDLKQQSNKALTQSNLYANIPFKTKKEKQEYLKAIADNLWGFLKNKEGDLDKEVIRQKSSKTDGYKPSKSTNYGHAMGAGTFGRKMAELISSLIVIQSGVPTKWVYETKTLSGASKDYSLFLKNTLIYLLLSLTKQDKQRLIKLLKITPIDSIIPKIWRDKQFVKVLKNKQPPEIYTLLETVRKLGNRSAHAGSPSDWDPKLSDYNQQELADALHDLLDTFVSEYLQIDAFFS